MLLFHCCFLLIDIIRKNDNYGIWIIILFGIIWSILADILARYIMGYYILSSLELGGIISIFITTNFILIIVIYCIYIEIFKVDENIV